jgi:hypothetical protein
VVHRLELKRRAGPHPPRIELGSQAWKAYILTIGLRMLRMTHRQAHVGYNNETAVLTMAEVLLGFVAAVRCPGTTDQVEQRV